MNLSKEYKQNHLTYTWEIENVSAENKKLIDTMITMDGVEFIGYDKFRINLLEIEQDISLFDNYIDFVKITFNEEASSLLSNILKDYEKSL